MKKVRELFPLAALLLLAVFTLSACSDDDDDKKAEDAVLTSFGFYAEDNAGVLSRDYVATIPTGSTDITIAMPASVNKSALVARFTVNEGNKVLVGGVTQASQSTANDFTNPVDYIVTNSDGTQNVRYAVTITKSTNGAGARLPPTAAPKSTQARCSRLALLTTLRMSPSRSAPTTARR